MAGVIADRDGGAVAFWRGVQTDIRQPIGARGLGLDGLQRRQTDQGVTHLIEIGGIIALRRQHPPFGWQIGDIESAVMGDDMDARGVLHTGGEAGQEFAGHELGSALPRADGQHERGKDDAEQRGPPRTIRLRRRKSLIAALRCPARAPDQAQYQRETRHQDRHTEDVEEGRRLPSASTSARRLCCTSRNWRSGLGHAAADTFDLVLLLLRERDGVAARALLQLFKGLLRLGEVGLKPVLGLAIFDFGALPAAPGPR